MSQPLHTLSLPLQGVRLIEASAGTGKTHAIGGLYLRLLLERRLSVEQILVVTFTKAATAELRGRIRLRIHRLLSHLQQPELEPDAELQAFASLVAQTEAGEQLLRDALLRMDEAAIFTIHGFCQRVLQEHALESGVLFDSDFAGRDRPLELSVVEDYWRRQTQTLDQALAAWWSGHWQEPAALHTTLQPLLQHPQAPLLYQTGADGLAVPEALLQAAQALQQGWRSQRQAIIDLLLTSKALSRNKDSGYPAPRVEVAAQALDLWSPTEQTLQLPNLFELFTYSHLQKQLKKGAEAPQHHFFEQAERYRQLREQSDHALYGWLLADARAWCQAALEQRKRQRRVLFFEDLLSRLDQALQGPHGSALIQALRRRYPAALIDEFQDTDALQYRLFSRLFAADGSALLMIGDPKQAIYRFRGADIFTYIQARRDTPAENRYTLTSNWRSSERLVDAVNRLFSHAEIPFRLADIPFLPSQAAGRADETPLLEQGQLRPPFQLWFLSRDDGSKPVTKAHAEPTIAQACAEEIARLLRLANAGQLRIGDRALGAGDIALLVRDRNEAAVIRQALQQAGIGSVIQSRANVLESEEAAELTWLLQGVLHAGSDRLLRAACASSLLGVQAQQFDEAAADAHLWEGLHQRFLGYRQQWQRHGFMAMFLQLLHAEGIAARLLAGPQGERRLTNLLHLAELLQGAAQWQPNPETLLRWFEDQRNQPDHDAEEQMLALESDERLVRIVTIHASKGLQYPIVFLPYLFRGREHKEKPPLLLHDPASGQPLIDLYSPRWSQHVHLAREEQLAEDARLAYVALTRAQYRCYLVWGSIYGVQHGILQHLLHPHGMGDDQALLRELQQMAGDDGCFQIQPLPSLPEAPVPLAAGAPEAALQARSFNIPLQSNWRITSYSSLISGLEQPLAERLAEGGAAEESDVLDALPAGTRFGLFLHALLEQLDFPTAQGERLQQEIERQLQRHGLEPHWAPAVAQLVANLLDTPLDPQGSLRLRELTAQRRLSEMAFHYPLALLEDHGLNGLLQRFRQHQEQGQRLRFQPQQGLMLGFIDLVFEHQGRYYLADYKSNQLGGAQAYAPEALWQAMASHRYDLQYLIYAVALHRYLGQRLPGYDYGQHFGGVYYLFPRGMSPSEGAGRGVFFDRPAWGLIEALDRYFRGES